MRRRTALKFDSLETRDVPAGLIAFGSDAGTEPFVRVLNRTTGASRFEVRPYESTFRGGVRVALGDVTGDGQDDLIVAPGAGRTPLVKIYDGSTGTFVRQFLAAPPSASTGFLASNVKQADPYRGGLTVAIGDLNGDGRTEIVTACDRGTGYISVFGRTGSFIRGFAAGRGVRVAIGDLDGDGRAEIVAGDASTGARVQAFDFRGFVRELSFTAFASESQGVTVATADTDGDGSSEIIVGAGSIAGVSIRNGRTGAELRAVAPSLDGSLGVRVGGAMISADGKADLIVGSAATGDWACFNGAGANLDDGSETGFDAGLWVASSTDQVDVNRHATQVLLDWNDSALDAIRAQRTPPPKASRALAILQVSVYDAVNGITRGGKKYLVAPAAEVGASLPAAVSQAAYTALVALFPAELARFDALLATSLGAISDSQAKTDGIAWGLRVAQAILAARASDGSSATTTYTPGTDPGDWRPTLPANAAALLPSWGNVATFGIGDAASYVSKGPTALSSAQWAADFNQVKELGSKTSTTRTADQRALALFWADGGGTFTPPGHWNAIAAQLANADGLDLQRTARLFAQLDVAEADAAIACWKAKYKYEFWRPITAIRAADTDGNASTVADTTWEPLIVTPPFPEYSSGHSTFSGAAATVLARYFDANRSFAVTSDDGLSTRNFTSFQAAADEAAMSRLYGGIHYNTSNQDGLTIGKSIGAKVLRSVV